MNLALFDFDGTITDRDSFFLFLWHYDRKKVILTICRHLPKIIAYKAGRYPNQQLKEIFLSAIFKREKLKDLEPFIQKFNTTILPTIIRQGFWEQFHNHQKNQDHMVIVTAGIDIFLSPWCRENRFTLIGSQLEISRDGYITGRLDGPNCMGEEKVTRIQSAFSLENYETIFAYGDTSSDLPMLSLAHPDKQYYKPFRT